MKTTVTLGQDYVLHGVSADGNSDFLSNLATNITYKQDAG